MLCTGATTFVRRCWKRDSRMLGWNRYVSDMRDHTLSYRIADPFAHQLWDDIIWSLEKLDQYKEDEAEESDEAAEDAEVTAPDNSYSPSTAGAVCFWWQIV